MCSGAVHEWGGLRCVSSLIILYFIFFFANVSLNPELTDSARLIRILLVFASKELYYRSVSPCPAFTWVMGIKLRSSYLCSKHFIDKRSPQSLSFSDRRVSWVASNLVSSQNRP